MASRARTIVVSWLATAAALFGFWLLLVDTVETAQVYTGLAAAAIGALGSELVRAQRISQVRPSVAWLGRLWRPALSVPRDLLVLTAQAMRAAAGHPPRSRFRALPFEAGGEDPRDNARRALAELAGSFSPNTYAIGVDVERGELLIHQLLPDEKHPETSIDPMELR